MPSALMPFEGTDDCKLVAFTRHVLLISAQETSVRVIAVLDS